MTGLEDLARKIGTSPTSLFLGAGASFSAGGPNGKELINSIKAEFMAGEGDGSMFSLCEKIMGPDDGRRSELESFIRKSLNLIVPSEIHKYLFSLPWRAVMTTNYDQIPELIGTTLDGSRTIKSIIRPFDDINVDRLEILHCLKLFGDMSIRYPEDGCMVLSETDRRQAYAHQSSLYRQFYDLSSTGNVIYLGYSFNDKLVLDILVDMRRVLRGFPWQGYAILPTRPNSEVLEKMRAAKIEWIQGSFEDFIEACRKVHGEKPESTLLQVKHTQIHRVTLSLGREIERNISGKYHFMNQNEVGYDTSAEAFVSGDDKGFEPFKRKYDFPRRFKCHRFDSSVGTIVTSKEFVQARSSLDSSSNAIFCVTGGPASGKTIAAKRIAFDWYQSGNPVIFAEHPLKLDRTAFVSLIDIMRERYLASNSFDGQANVAPIRYLFVVENCGPYLPELVELSNYLKSIAKPVDILLVERSTTLPLEKARAVGISMVLELDDSISSTELQGFLDHFAEHRLLLDKTALISNMENPDVNSSFFALLYTTLNGIQDSLSNSIKSAFRDLDTEAQRIYSGISLFRAYSQNAYLSIISALTGITASELEGRVLGDLQSLIAYDHKRQLLSVNHRIIAEIIVNEAFVDNITLKNEIIKAIKILNPSNINHMDLLRDLVIGRIFTENRFRPFIFQHKEEIFHSAIGVLRSSTLLHHLARLYLHERRLKECRETIRQAYLTKEMRLHEREHYIKDTEARLEIEEGKLAANEKRHEDIHLHFGRAELLFGEARINEIVTPHPYQGLAMVYYERSKYCPSLDDKVNLLLWAISVYTNYKSIAGEMSHIDMENLIHNIYNEFDGMGFTAENAKQIAGTHRNAEGFAYLAYKAIKNGGAKPMRASFNESLRLVNEGLAYDAGSIWLNRLKIECIKQLFPDDSALLGKALEDWKRNSKTPHISLTFEMAKYEYMNGQERGALQRFRDLRRETVDHPERFIHDYENDVWTTEGLPRTFRGRIIKVPRRDGSGQIRCSPDEPVKEPVEVLFKSVLYDSPERGNEVFFKIAFSFVGPQAIDVTGL